MMMDDRSFWMPVVVMGSQNCPLRILRKFQWQLVTIMKRTQRKAARSMTKPTQWEPSLNSLHAMSLVYYIDFMYN